ncbi:MAG: hypothetical protein RR325_05220 [Bacilli bacterium]
MKFFKYFSVFAIMIFSFYYTDKIANFLLEKNQLYVEINSKKDDYKIESVSAIIDGNFIIPGIEGVSVNTKESYFNMLGIEKFNKYYLVYSKVSPEISIENNKDKIIKNGNRNKSAISFIIEDEIIASYFKRKDIKVDYLVTEETFNKDNFFEQINNDTVNYKKVESLLNKNNLNKHICIINKDNEELCRKNKSYLIKPNIILNNINFLEVKNKITKGDIVHVKGLSSIENLNLLINTIKYKDLSIVTLSILIDEDRNIN